MPRKKTASNFTFDDFEVDFPIINFKLLREWTFDIKGLYLEYSQNNQHFWRMLKSTDYSYFDGTALQPGSLNRLVDKLVVKNGDLSHIDPANPPAWPDDMTWALKYIEYMGTCTVKIKDITVSAVGGFARILFNDRRLRLRIDVLDCWRWRGRIYSARSRQ